MSKFNSITNNFTSGEFSPKAIGRVDLEEYKNAVALMKNFIVLKNGGASKRTGTRFIKDITSTAIDPGLIPFVASNELGYNVVIDAGRNNTADFIRIFKANGDEMVINMSPYLTLNGIYSTYLTDLSPEGWIFTQVADGLFVTHSSGTQAPFVITRLTETTFTVNLYSAANPYNNSSISEILKVPYRDVNITALTFTPGALTGAIPITASADFFVAGHIGAIIKITHSGTTGAARITSIASPTVANATVIEDFGAAIASTEWEEQAWSDFRGWPRSLCYFEQRLDWGGNDSEPDTLWGSLTRNVFHMMARKFVQDQGVPADVTGLNYFGDNAPTDPYSFIPGSADVNKISWLAPTGVLNLGTLSTEFVGSGGDEILSAESVGFKAQTNYGSRASKVLNIGDEILYVSRDGRRIRNFRFSDNNGSNISIDLNLLADHMSRVGGGNYGFLDMAYEKSSDVVWLRNANDKLISLTYQLDNPTVAWAQHEIAGEDVSIRGVTAIPNFNGIADDPFLIVKRTIDGNTVYYIETIPGAFDADSLNNTPLFDEDLSVYLDAAKQDLFLGAGDTITGLTHLNNTDVTVVLNGKVLGDFTVDAGGEIDLGQSFPIGSRFIIGLKYTAQIDFLPLSSGADFGSALGNIKRIDTAIIRFYKTFDCKVSSTKSSFSETISFGDDIFTGLKKIEVGADPERDMALRITSEQPYPCNILFATMRGVSND